MRLMMLIFLATLIITQQPLKAEEVLKVQLTGLQLKASSIALKAFSKDEPEADLSNYNVYVEETKNMIEVIFVPKHDPGKLTIRGGKTKFGREIHFRLLKDNLTIINKSYAR